MDHTPRISEATRERVERPITQLGCRPNAVGRRLITGRSNLMGLVVSNISNPFYPEMVKTIVEVGAE